MKKILTLLMLLNSTLANAAWSPPLQIKSVSYEVWTDHHYVQVETATGVSYRYYFDTTNTASIAIANSLYSNLLAAGAAGKSVKIYLDGSTTDFSGVAISF